MTKIGWESGVGREMSGDTTKSIFELRNYGTGGSCLNTEVLPNNIGSENIRKPGLGYINRIGENGGRVNGMKRGMKNKAISLLG